MIEPQEDEIEPPDIGSWLVGFLSVQRSEYELQFAPKNTGGELDRAIDTIERYARELVTTGVIPGPLEQALEGFRPGDQSQSKVRDLLGYAVVHHRLEFDTAEEVCGQLFGLDKRVEFVALLT